MATWIVFGSVVPKEVIAAGGIAAGVIAVGGVAFAIGSAAADTYRRQLLESEEMEARRRAMMEVERREAYFQKETGIEDERHHERMEVLALDDREIGLKMDERDDKIAQKQRQLEGLRARR